MTLSALGIFSAAGAGGADLGSYDLLDTRIMTGSTTFSITFSSLGTYASTYKHLQIRTVFKNTSGTTWSFGRFNGDSGFNYAYHELRGNGSSVNSYNGTSQNYINVGVFGTNWGSMITDILDPFSSTKNTTIRSLKGVIESDGVQLTSGLWNNTAAITSYEFFCTTGNFDTGTRVSLYGLKGQKMPTPTYTPLATVTLGSSASSVSFASIPASYRDLIFVMTIATNTPMNNAVRFNGDTGSNYSRVFMSGQTPPTSGTGGGGTSLQIDQAAFSGTVLGEQATILQVMDYSATDKHKTVLIRQNRNGANAGVEAIAGRYASTSAITSMVLLPLSTATYSAGSRIDLYGVIA